MTLSQTSARRCAKTHPTACAKTWVRDHASTTCPLSLRRRRSHVEKFTLETVHSMDFVARLPGNHPARRVDRRYPCLLERSGNHKSHGPCSLGSVDHD